VPEGRGEVLGLATRQSELFSHEVDVMRTHRLCLLLFLCGLPLALPAGAQPAAATAAPPAAGTLTILLSNDDGYDAPGLRALEDALRPLGRIYVAAPAADQSGKGHSITTSDPIPVTEHKQPDGVTWYAVAAPPATCVRVAVEALLPRRPDVVISGINRGANLGIVVYYSGTVGAAREAAIVGLPAIAVSIQGDEAKDYAATAAYVRQLLEQLRAQQMLKPGLFLNVNAPAGPAKGVRVTRLSLRANEDHYARATNPRGRTYFWSAWKPLDDDDEGTDVWAFARGYITVTPMLLEVTALRAMAELRGLESRSPAPAGR
jgi:5'-nucleotidase